MERIEGKRGQRIKLTAPRAHYDLVVGDEGVLLQDNDGAPFVLFDRTQRKWAIDQSDLELIPTYTPAVGDWVRLTADNDMWGKAGDVGRVIAREDKGERLEFVQPVHGGGAWLVPVNKLEAWAPKVGERVRFTDECSGKYWFFGPDTRFKSGVVTVDNHNREYYRFRVDTGDGIAFINLQHIEPLPVASPQPALVIEAGKFYRTRDGRKVGPLMTTGNNEYWPFKWPEQTMYYKVDGYSCPGSAHLHRDQDDLIAEWQETTNVGAQVDTLAEEYGPAAAVASNDNAAKPRFKVGDRVVVTCNRTNGGDPIREYVIGSAYRITSIVKDLNGNDAVKLDNHYQYLKQGQFQLTTTAIVALIENGQPKPADLPHVHASQAAAEREAKRLAGVHKGKQFGVYVLATTAEEPAPVYAHEWQRLAVKGRKIDAIKELRGLTGMGLKPSKDAVEHFLAAA